MLTDHAGPKAPDDLSEQSLPAGRVRLAPGVEVESSLLRMTASRSPGPGGQNVNKRSTRIELRVRLYDLPMSVEALSRLRRMAGRKVTDEGELLIVSSSERSQLGNREECVERLRELVARAMVAPKPRKATKPSKGSRERRLQGKRERSEVKKSRGSRHED